MEILSKLPGVILGVKAENEQVCMGSRVLQIYNFSIILIALFYLELGFCGGFFFFGIIFI